MVTHTDSRIVRHFIGEVPSIGSKVSGVPNGGDRGGDTDGSLQNKEYDGHS